MILHWIAYFSAEDIAAQGGSDKPLVPTPDEPELQGTVVGWDLTWGGMSTRLDDGSFVDDEILVVVLERERDLVPVLLRGRQLRSGFPSRPGKAKPSQRKLPSLEVGQHIAVLMGSDAVRMGPNLPDLA